MSASLPTTDVELIQPATVVKRRTGGRSPIEFVVDRIWRFFCSVRAAVYEIILLAVMVLLGTLRGSSVPRSIGDAIPLLDPVIKRWYAYDFFHALPFIGLLTLLSLAITVCTINRAPAIWRAIAHPTIPTSHSFLRQAEPSITLSSPHGGASLLADMSATLRDRRYRVLTELRGKEIHLYADKNRYARLATFPFHLALILILIGGIVGARYGFREKEFIVPEGSTRAVGHGTGLSVELERFTDTYRENGAPREYRSDLVIYRDGKRIEDGSITVNNPISTGTVTFYQASFGQAVELRVADLTGKVLYADSTDLGIYKLSDNPESPAGIVELPDAGVRLHVVGPDANPANQPELDQLKLRAGQMYVQVRPLDEPLVGEAPAAIIDQGRSAEVAGLSITFIRERRFTLLQVASNPGIPIFLAASFLLVAGLAITFYLPHRRIRGIIADTPVGSSATLAPLAKRDWSGQRDFTRLMNEAAGRLGPQREAHPPFTESSPPSKKDRVRAVSPGQT
ncbi:MAG: cytochrome c biogenesis protein ResB [Chloroflexia bacterium]|nr:cytochrome c biogenesis protein ResB [Chloroflexia bacterium]